jgi:hypothetical protein
VLSLSRRAEALSKVACGEGPRHARAAFLAGGRGQAVDEAAAPRRELVELGRRVGRDPARVALVGRCAGGGETLADLGVAPHAWQQRSREVGELAHGGRADEEVGVALGGRCCRLGFELGLRDAELAREGSVQLHLLAEDHMGEVGEAADRREVGRARCAEREHARVLDEEQVVLAHVVRESIDRERAVADAAYERVRVLCLPDVRRAGAQLVREARARHPAAR